MSAAKAERVEVALGDRSYDILIGDDLIARAGADIARRLPGRPVAIVSDETVAGLYLDRLQDALDDARITHHAYTVAPGEASKSFESFSALSEALLQARIERDTVIVALGGGVVGDLAGFAAAVTLRGLDFVQIPTTLLAQVDSSVGGKTAINARAGKNLIGAFHQPRLVLADIASLDTLPPRELLAGYAETVKYGLIGDRDFFAWCEANGRALIAGDRRLRRSAVAKACRAKANVVARDERETDVRALLNLGHTFGHALEAAAGYSDALLHGEAVAIGMVMAMDLSVRLRLCRPADAARVRHHFAETGLPTVASAAHFGGAMPSADRLMDLMAADKKVKRGAVRFVLVRGIGDAFLADDVDPADVRALLENAAAA